MKMFLDSARSDEIRYALDMWDIDGVTTNPRHVRASGKPLATVLEEIAELFAGTDKPVSVEVNPHLTDWEKIVEEGIALRAISANFVIKVGAGEAGFRAMRELARQEVPVNATLIFSTAQAWHAARSGAAYISPFIGWRETYGDHASSLIPEVAAMLDEHQYPCQIIAAAMRNGRQLADAALAGAHCVTASLAVYKDSFHHPYTTMGEKLFQDAWDSTPGGES